MNLVIVGILLLLLCMAAFQDFRSYRIGNKLVIPGAALGVLLNTILPEGSGFIEAIAGWGVGLLLLLPFYLLRTLGAGDVKLVAMVGAFVGLHEIFVVLLYIMITGGVLALLVAFFRGKLRQLIENFVVMLLMVLSFKKSGPLKEKLSVLEVGSTSIEKLPYGVAIAAGTAIFLVMHTYLNF
jgi:prepilin peptidase CpaA